MNKLSLAARSLWAKKSKQGDLLWLPLYVHMADSASMAKRLWNFWLAAGARRTIGRAVSTEEAAEQLYIFLAAAHDLGKATPVFQAKCSTYPAGDLDERIAEGLARAGLPLTTRDFPHAGCTPHALATFVLLEEDTCAKNIAVIAGAHHGKPPARDSRSSHGLAAYGLNYHLSKQGKEAWRSVQKELIDYALSLAGAVTQDEFPRPGITAQVLLSGLLIMTDWVVSNEHYLPYFHLESEPAQSDLKTRAQTAWKRLALPQAWRADNSWMRESLCAKRFGFTANHLQSIAAEIAGKTSSPGIAVVEAPMGAGKTEAALIMAEIFAEKTNRSGVFFALPTQATSDGIFPRMLEWVNGLDESGPHSIRLAHGKAHFNDDFQALKFLGGSSNVEVDEAGGSAMVHAWFEGNKKALLADFVLGTIDQLLSAALKHKHVMLRHLGLANKVVIIDECHAYDAYMSQYLDMALRWLGAYQVPVIVLSATLPVQRRKMVIEAYQSTHPLSVPPVEVPNQDRATKDLPPAWAEHRGYPLVTWTDGQTVHHRNIPADGKTREVELAWLEDSAVTAKVEQLLANGGCAGIIVNTVKRAQELAVAMRQHFGAEVVRLVHSRFLAPDRAQKETELLAELGKPSASRRRPERRIVIGTQVLEQSLDIDFDVLVTDICPMDLLLQRIGRLHRHTRNRPQGLVIPRCFVTGVDGEALEGGAKAIYGEYLLLRTKALLPRKIILPSDIPDLVQNTYDDAFGISPEPLGYQEAKMKWQHVIADKESRARAFRISRPWLDKNTNMLSWLDTDVHAKVGEAAVRDTDETIEVLLMQSAGDNKLRVLSGQGGGNSYYPGRLLQEADARMIARQRIRLPAALCTPRTILATIAELEQLTEGRLSCWQQSAWLKGELTLILDETGCARLNGYCLTYSRDDGLLYEKEVKGNE